MPILKARKTIYTIVFIVSSKTLQKDNHGIAFTLIKDKYLLVACDVSDINLCPNGRAASTMLALSNNPHNKLCNQVHLNAMSVVPDGYFVDYAIQDNIDKNEILACAQMMRSLSARNLEQETIITCDRAYESYYLMMLAQSLRFYFCIMAKDVYSNGINSRYKGLIDENKNNQQQLLFGCQLLFACLKWLNLTTLPCITTTISSGAILRTNRYENPS